MGVNGNVAPVIIKRKKVVAGGGHHGGAWKVAYADFVTAMMAFFMLMWLLNATTETQRKGIADYFSPTVSIVRVSGGGEGNLGGQTVFSEEEIAQSQTGATNLRPTESDRASGAGQGDGDGEAAVFEQVTEALMSRGGESAVADALLQHIVTRVTDEGLVIEFFDTADARLFDGDAQETPLMRELADMLARVSRLIENDIAVEAHVRAVPVVVANSPVWDVSSRRADRMRQLLESGGLDADRVNRVTGHADREPVVDNPMALRNNRVEVVFLR